MKSKVYAALIMKRILLTLVTGLLSLTIVNQVQAKGPEAMKGNATMAIVFVPNHTEMRIRNPAEIKARLLRILASKPASDTKSKTLSTRGCGCTAAAPEEFASFFSCLRSCLAGLGVSVTSVIMCGAACAGAETGIGAIACAICVGVSVTFIEFCALGCAMNGGKGYGGLMEARGTKHRRAADSLQAKLLVQPARAVPD